MKGGGKEVEIEKERRGGKLPEIMPGRPPKSEVRRHIQNAPYKATRGGT